MTNKEFYQAVFSQVHGQRDILWEDFERMEKRKKLHGIWKAAIVAAVLVAALTGIAVAADWFGLRELVLPQQNMISTIDEEGVEGEAIPMDVISLSGFMDTPESKALAEWNAFYESYDQDGEIIQAIGNDPTGFEEKYGLYSVYTQEMADKVEEIIAKYGLRLHTQFQGVFPEMWPDAVGAAFLADNHIASSGYIYEDGTFHYDGEAQVPGYGKIDYQLRRTVRGSFNDVILNIMDVSQFREWKYKTACGVTVNLSLSYAKALVVADLGDSFVTVNVLAGTETSPEDVFSSGAITEVDLEVFADGIDFRALSEVRKPDMEQLAREEEQLTAAMYTWEGYDPLYEHTGIEETVAEMYVSDLAELLDGKHDYLAEALFTNLAKRISFGEGQVVAELFVYPCVVTTQSGTYEVENAEELEAYYEEVVEPNRDELISALQSGDLFAHDGLVGVGNGAAWFGLLEDGSIRLFTLQGQNYAIRPLEGITAG